MRRTERSGHAILATLGLLAALGLAGCGETPGRQPDAPASDVPEAEASAEANSIIRNDIEVERAPEPLAPLNEAVSFADNGDRLDDAGRALLDEILASPQMAAGGAITLGGHTDSAGYDATNLRVSRKRAEAVAAYLEEKGVDPARVTVIAFGEMNPAMPNAAPDGQPDEAARRVNRRVEVHIAVPEDAQSDLPPMPETPPVGKPG